MLTLLFDGIAYGMLLFVLRQRLRWVMTSPAVRAVEADRERSRSPRPEGVVRA